MGRRKQVADPSTFVVCLGWCGSRPFKPRFPFDRYCAGCRKKKAKVEETLGRAEENVVVCQALLGHGFVPPD